ncbi:14023_t:CDS:2 [Ambispora leptoticha]|uniref:14023_t:CDS:1 n=1 Tax=Ambispora leptoticha TaxID=144679 RepID=A0A9N9CHF0_9GLOM|nr:14023_t:CDS:2 [Ambispora leptoticha]
MNTTDINTNNSTTGYNFSNGLTRYDKLVITHGKAVLLSIPFLFTAPITTFIARFGKTRLPTSWFRLHWTISLFLTVPLTAAGFLIAHFVQQEPNRKSNWALVPHSVFGHIAGIGLFLEALLGWIHRKLRNSDRGFVPWWTKLHRIWGYIVCFSGFIDIGFGFRLYETPVAWYIATYIWVAFLSLSFIYLYINIRSESQPKIGQAKEEQKSEQDE